MRSPGPRPSEVVLYTHDPGSDSFFLCTWASCVSVGKVFVGNKREIAESRIPELNTYVKVMASGLTAPRAAYGSVG